jgi:hypothetical protein
METKMKNKYIKANVPLMVLGAVGLLAFVLLLPRFFPAKAVNLGITKAGAIETASKFLKEKGYRLDGYHVAAMVDSNEQAFPYIQQRHGWDKAGEIYQTGYPEGLGFHWYVKWYKNLPQSLPYEQYQVLVSGAGNVYSFAHIFPRSFDWPEGRRAHISQENALDMAKSFLANRGVRLETFKKDAFNTEQYKKRTDHVFKWVKTLPAIGGKVNISVVIQGDEVGRFGLTFGVPTEADQVIKQVASRNSFFGFLAYIFAFLFCIMLQVIFLKKYHEGEVGVKTAVIVFLVCWLTLAAETWLKITSYSFSATIGQMSFDGVGLTIFILLSLVVWPFFSIMSFSAWSVGEALGRDSFNRKFTAMDSLFSGKPATLNAASSMFNGYLAGVSGLGLLALLASANIWLFNGSLDGVNYRTPAVPLAFLIPPLTAISSAFLSEMTFRLFGNFFLYRFFKRRWLCLVLSAIPWTFYAIGFWNITISISPMVPKWSILYIMGLFLGYIFWKFDLLTSVTAHFTIMGVMQSLPLLTAAPPELFYQGIAALGLVFLPAVFIVRGFIKKKVFSFEADLTPGHIKRITERVRMAKELEIARRVQMNLLPAKSPDIEGLEVEGICIPAHEVGGDYYDFIPLEDSKLGVVIGDVSGKGVPAAIYMTLTKGVIQSQAEHNLSPGEVLTRVNRSLYKMMDPRSFVTLFFAVIDSKADTITFSRAGHNPLFYFRYSENRILSLKPEGIALGIEKGEIFSQSIKEDHMQMEKDDLIVFYTDGFTEAMNKNLEEYGENRLQDIILRSKDKPVQQIIADIVDDVNLFVKGYPQHDDMTMVIVKVF